MSCASQIGKSSTVQRELVKYTSMATGGKAGDGGVAVLHPGTMVAGHNKARQGKSCLAGYVTWAPSQRVGGGNASIEGGKDGTAKAGEMAVKRVKVAEKVSSKMTCVVLKEHVGN